MSASRDIIPRMMGDAAVARDLSYEDYPALERATDQRHAWVDGVAYASAGGTPTHSRLSAQMIMELGRPHGSAIPCEASFRR